MIPPFVWRPVKGRIVVKMPYNAASPSANPRWLKSHLGNRIEVKHAGNGRWEIARTHLRHVVTGLAQRFGLVHVYLDYLAQQRCDTRCQDAKGDDCVCQCAGEHHGGADYQRGWIQVGDTTLVQAKPEIRRVYKMVVRDAVEGGR